MFVEHKVSGYDFVRAMLLAGFRVVGSALGHVHMEKNDRELLVPQQPVLDENTIVALLDEAKVLPLEFVVLLNRLGSRDTWPEQREIDADVASKRKRGA